MNKSNYVKVASSGFFTDNPGSNSGNNGNNGKSSTRRAPKQPKYSKYSGKPNSWMERRNRLDNITIMAEVDRCLSQMTFVEEYHAEQIRKLFVTLVSDNFGAAFISFNLFDIFPDGMPNNTLQPMFILSQFVLSGTNKPVFESFKDFCQSLETGNIK